ncbi:hypothetical protein FI667_g15076, partial [Globisporangium splendens]
MSVAQIDPFDAFALLPDAALLEGPASPAHAALAAFLLEMDALELKPGAYSGTTDMLATLDELPLPPVAEPAAPSAADCVPVVPAPAPTPAVVVSKGASDALAASVQQNRAVAIALEPARGLKRKRRVRPKEELEVLRGEAESLQRDLEALHQQQANAALAPAQAAAENNETQMTLKRAKVLKIVPASTLAENRALRQTVQAQLQFAKTFGDTLLQTQKKTRSALLQDDRSSSTTQTPLNSTDLVVYYEALTGKLDALYSQLDQVFADAELPESKLEFFDARVVLDQEKNAKLQFRDVRVAPFDFQSVCAAAWRTVKDKAVHGIENVPGMTSPNEDDLLLVKTPLMVETDGDNDGDALVIPGRMVLKRFVTKERMVMCWEGTMEWPDKMPKGETNQNNETDGSEKFVPLRERGWVVIKPLPGPDGDTSNSKMSVLQLCMLMNPGVSDEQIIQVPEQVKQMADLVIPSFRQIMESHYQLIENLLLDEYLK